jgi:hypothetical protein
MGNTFHILLRRWLTKHVPRSIFVIHYVLYKLKLRDGKQINFIISIFVTSTFYARIEYRHSRE